MCHEEWNSSSLKVPWKTAKETTNSCVASYLHEKCCQKPMCLPQACNCNDIVINTSSVLKMGATSSSKTWESSVTTRCITHNTASKSLLNCNFCESEPVVQFQHWVYDQIHVDKHLLFWSTVDIRELQTESKITCMITSSWCK
jgi:hypothetical protein